MSENARQQTTAEPLIELLAEEIARKVFYHNHDHERFVHLKRLLLAFAEEVRRAAIEPAGWR